MPKSKREYDKNGWYEVDENPIARSGMFEYLGSSISSDLEPDKIYKVYRPEEALNNPETIKSFELIPWIPKHVMLGDEFGNSAESVGVQGVTGESVYFDTKTKELKSKIKVFGSKLISMIDDLGVKDLSIGMVCDWVIGKGTTPDGDDYDVMQTNILGNHLASVDVGRAGANVAVMDSQDVISYAMDSLEFIKVNNTNTNEVTTMTIEEILAAIKEGKMSKEDGKALMAKLSELYADEDKAEDMDEAEDMKDEAKDEDEKEKSGAMDSAIARAVDKAVKKAVKGLALDEKAIIRRINGKNALADKVLPLTGAFDHSEMSEQELAVYATKKLNIACDSGHELSTLKGFLAAQKDVQIIRDTGAQDSAVVKSETSEKMGL